MLGAIPIPYLVVVAEDVEESHEVFMKLDGETPPCGADPRPEGVTRSESGCWGFSILALDTTRVIH